MAEQAGEPGRPIGPFGRVLFGVARALAIFGGLLCCAVAAVVTISVAGRYLFRWAVPGDYDIAGILCGCAIFAFLPYCQLRRGNVLVDFFTARSSPRSKALLDAAATAIYLAAAIMLTWRLYYGLFDMRQSAEVIAAFNFYRWWTIPFDLFCMVILILAIAYSLGQMIADVRSAGPAARPAGAGDRSHE